MYEYKGDVTRRCLKVYEHFIPILDKLAELSVEAGIDDAKFEEIIRNTASKIDTRVFENKSTNYRPGGPGAGGDIEAFLSSINNGLVFNGVKKIPGDFRIRSIVDSDGSIEIQLDKRFKDEIESHISDIRNICDSCGPLTMDDYIMSTPNIIRCVTGIADIMYCSFTEAKDIMLLFM